MEKLTKIWFGWAAAVTATIILFMVWKGLQ